MAMVIQHNLTAMNSNRQLGVITSGQAKSSEKLSSGYKINRAADDAAGLKISEKMRSQIRGLNKASSNAQDGVSLIQTAEGALNEAHSILQRMHELAVQGANDTNQDIDRDAINQELTALTDELDRISQTTQFNKQELLDGSFTDKNLHVGANANQKISISIEGMDAASIGLRNFVYFKGTDSVEYNHFTYAGVSYKYDPNKTDASNLAMFKEKVSEATDAMWSNGMIANGSDGKYYLSAGGTAYSTTASAYEEINFLGFNATYNRNNNYVDVSKNLFPKVQEFVQWFIEQPFGFEMEIYENLIDILRDCGTAMKEHDNVLMMDALEQGISGYLEIFLPEEYFREKENSCVNGVKG